MQKKFTDVEPYQVWVTEITYIRNYRGWRYLAMVIKLFARNVVRWLMKPLLSPELAWIRCRVSVWILRPARSVMLLSVLGSQY